MTEKQKEMILAELNELISERNACEYWNEKYEIQRAIYEVINVLDILGFNVEEINGKFNLDIKKEI